MQSGELRLFNIITGLFVTALIISVTASSKIAAIGPFNLPAGTILFPITFIFNDILTEVYGYARSRRVIWTGLGCQALTAIVFLTVQLLPPAPFWPHQEAYNVILGLVPRIAVAGMIAYFCGEFANSIVLSKMKYSTHGQRGFAQGWRFVASTIVGEGVDSLIFMSVAFIGQMSTPDLVKTFLTLYVVKVVYEIVALPFSIRFANWIKKAEGVDIIDNPRSTRYSPFALE